jgi:glycosyltransferase involved in cell wall biosynthesis
MEYMALGIKELGGRVCAINTIYSYKNENKDEHGVSEKGIEYMTFNSHKRFKFLCNIKKTYKLLKAKKTDGQNVVIMASSRTHKMLIDIFVAKLAGYKTLFLFHEWRSALKMHSIFHKIDAWLKDHFIIRIFDSYLPISHFLLEKCNKVSKRKKKLIIPILADFANEPVKHIIKPQFCYCCGVWYMMRNTLLLDAMDLLVKDYPNAQMVLVLSGNEKDIDLFKESIKGRLCANNIIVKTKVPFKELNALYSSSSGLIIPLDPSSIADIARFSQKVAEYVATGRPIITNAVGEIPYYFKDGISAYIVDYSVDGFYLSMKKILDDKEKSDEIGYNGFMVGKNNFDYKKVSKGLLEFVKMNNIGKRLE